ncbi:MAG: ABC transporter substrate-binding protein, partial [Actinomycetota bacterium]
MSIRPTKLLGLGAAALLMLVAVPAAGQSPAAPPIPKVTVPFPQDDGTLTPYTFELGYSLVTLIYDTLMWRDEKGIPQPWLAEKVDVSADGTSITATLPENVAWQDGKPLTAADVVFTFRWITDHEHPRFTQQLRALREVRQESPRTVVFSLSRPSPGFLDQPLADVPIVPRHLWEGLPPGRVAPEGLPVGSGPYRLVRYLPDEGYRFDANLSYFRGVPSVGAIEVPILNDADKTLGAFERGRVDMLPINRPAAAVERLESLST